MAEAGTVLVTGGSGYIGGWCVIGLLQQGYTVRTTVRGLSREAEVRAWLAKAVDAQDRLSFHAVDLMADAGWDAATEGCDYVLHVASPISAAEPKDENELIVPAREGAKRAVNAAIKGGVKRVVLTSSVAATSGPTGLGVDDETAWTDATLATTSAYSKSKTLAERDAWALIAEKGGATSLATVNPALVIGPVLGKDFSGSIQVVERLLGGRVPGIPRLGWNLVDVRDVADLHIRAMTAPEAAGQRFIAAGHWAWMADVATVLKARLGEGARKVPTRKAPDFLLHLMGLFDKDIAGVASGLGRKHDFSSAKAQSVLGWRPRPMEESIVDCGKSLIVEGVV